MLALTRASWIEDMPVLRLHLDDSNLPRTRTTIPCHIPEASLLFMGLPHLRSLIVEHKVANAAFLRTLHRQQSFPDLQQLVLSTAEADSWGPLPVVFDDVFEQGVPVIEAPNLRKLRLRTIIMHLPETY